MLCIKQPVTWGQNIKWSPIHLLRREAFFPAETSHLPRAEQNNDKKGKGERLHDHNDNRSDDKEARKENSGNAADTGDGFQWGWEIWGQKEEEEKKRKKIKKKELKKKEEKKKKEKEKERTETGQG